MDSHNQIFRKAALDKLSSPEQLDQLMQVTTPKSWVALAACCMLVVATVLWGIFGSIPTRVEAKGILLRQGGVFVATSRGDGNVIEIFAKTGDLVTNNQVLAHVSQPELKLRIEQNEETLLRLQRELETLKKFQGEERDQERQTLAKQRETLASITSDYKQQTTWLSQRVQAMEEMEKKGLVTSAQVLDSRIKLFAIQHDLEQANIQLRQLEITDLQAQERRRQQLLEKENQMKAAQDQIAYLRNLFQLNSQILSPYRGNVLEIMAKPGQLLTPNTPILSLQAAHKIVEARLFLSPIQGKLVEPFMSVAISPVSVKKEEFGFVLGTVSSVSDFPSTTQGMLKILENQALVAEFSRSGPPIEVTAALELSSSTVSGFRWSTRKGPPMRISSGTLCDAAITITNQRPIALVLPFLRKASGL